jgi:hypothetical protein
MLAGDVVNYGGAPGTLDVQVGGSVLDAGMTAGVRLAARGRSTLPHLDLRIAGNVPARTQADLDVSVAGDQAKVPVYVSWPLELAGEPVVDADPLGGRVRIVLAVANRRDRGRDVDRPSRRSRRPRAPRSSPDPRRWFGAN